MNTKSISGDQLYSLVSYLRTAAVRFHEFAEMMNTPAYRGLKEQFELQERQANEFANLFDNAEFIQVVEDMRR